MQLLVIHSQGILNKVPLSLAGLLFFEQSYSTLHVASVVLGLIAAILFANEKAKSISGAAEVDSKDPSQEATDLCRSRTKNAWRTC